VRLAADWRQVWGSHLPLSRGEDLDRAKRSKRVKYWISYRIPGSRKKYRQVVGLSIKKAKDADSKRKVQKRENRIFDMIPKDSNITNAEFEFKKIKHPNPEYSQIIWRVEKLYGYQEVEITYLLTLGELENYNVNELELLIN